MATEIGFVFPTLEDPMSGDKPTWGGIRDLAVTAESLGVDTVWVSDELYWKNPEWPGPRGFWECVALTSAVAAITSKVKVGTWVLSALHRNPGLTAKVGATLDEVSDGRYIFGLGAGHAGSQGEAFGFPDDKLISRYEEALSIIVPLLRGDEVTFQGQYHAAHELANRPTGPRGPGDVPLMLAGHGPRTIRLAAAHGDIWSAYATESSLPQAFVELVEMVDRACEEQGRDPSTLGRSIGVWVENPGSPVKCEDVGLGIPLRGGPDEVADILSGFEDLGVTMIELLPFPDAKPGLDFAGEVIAALDR